jgi:WD40 repeat protein
MVILVTGCTRSTDLLPNSLYYLQGPDESRQIWRLERDGISSTQVTYGTNGVTDFSVSTAAKLIAYVSDNRLFLADLYGKNGRVITDGNIDSSSGTDSFFRNCVSSPSFSPDGKTLAYGLDGIHLYDLKTGADLHLLTNLGNLLDQVSVYDKELYSPGAWSPDGKKLLIYISYFEGFTLAIYTPADQQPFIRVKTEGPACCMVRWAEDSKSILLANPYYTMDIPGLWKYDSNTGELITSITGTNDKGEYRYIGWPVEARNGRLKFFLAQVQRFPIEEGLPLSLFTTDKTQTVFTKIHPSEYRIAEALWFPDASSVLVKTVNSEEVWQILFIHPGNEPNIQLIEGAKSIGNLTWGP